jgi:hypothetical protein
MALGDVLSRLTLMLLKQENVEEETTAATWLQHQRNQFLHVTDGVTVTSLSASLLQQISAATNRLYQIPLNLLSRKL